MPSTHQTVVYRLGEVGYEYVGKRLNRSNPCNWLVGRQVRIVGREINDFSHVIETMLSRWLLFHGSI